MSITVEENVITIVEVSTGARGLQGEKGDTGDGVTEAIEILEIVAKSASATLALTDKGKMIRMNVASANTITVPPNSSVAFDTGNIVLVRQVGAGQTSIVAGSGVTLNVRTGKSLAFAQRGAVVSLHKVGTDEWDVSGDLANV